MGFSVGEPLRADDFPQVVTIDWEYWAGDPNAFTELETALLYQLLGNITQELIRRY